ncbi:efflux RND transporter periplasmic adaptor subunit [Ferrimonas marina]|uniref:RND family efflux transporter, MFP subunit n=1 Tax=Ferrimonas marina TaxID=299255 RepID=A0A1M5RQG8_9GAMM|nr:efflux RND transporter periplasmic adaptor subunit [Ferrimonas marina]SHH28446.1 RND family efflux transporter, MFP subunit [Ferrimonas marina]
MIRASLVPLALIAVLAGCQPQATATDQPEASAREVVTQPLTRQPYYPVEHRFVGRIASSATSGVGFELAGVVEQIQVDTGQRVQRGEVMARLDDALLRSEETQLEANLRQVAAQRELVDATIARQQTLQDQGYQSQQQLDELNSQQLELDALRQQLEAGLNANRIRQQKSRLLAPFDGVVSQRQLAPGQVVSPGQPVLTLVPDQQGEARVGVPVRLLSRLSPEQQYQVRLYQQRYPAQLLGRSAEVDATTRTVELRFALPEGTPVVNGDLVYLELEEQVPQSAARVPLEALVSGLRGRWNLMVAAQSEQGYQVERRDITLLHADDHYAYVEGAFDEQEPVIITGLQALSSGQRIRPRSGKE